MKVFFIGAGPGDPELLTRKGARLLASSRCCVFAGSLVSDEVLGLLPPDAERHDSARLTLQQVVEIYQDAARRDLDVIRLHSGDPALYGAIGEQIVELQRLGIAYEVVPGVSSFSAAAAALPAELTAPEVSQTVILTRVGGRTPVPQSQGLSQLAASRATLCLFLSVHKIEEVAQELIPHYGPDCPAAVVYHASRPDQRIVRGTLGNIASRTAAQQITKTAIIIVGHALSPGDERSKLYDGAFSHEYREASR